jgi:hypothetical protein
MANSTFPDGLANQVSSESLDTFLQNLPTSTDLEDLTMDQQPSHSPVCENSRHSNVKLPATVVSHSTTVSINDKPQDINNAPETSHQEALSAVLGSNHVARAGQHHPNGRIHPSTAASAPPSVAAPIISGTVPEFLYQLFKMLTDNNREVIEWADGK